jgi:hypothetical protein
MWATEIVYHQWGLVCTGCSSFDGFMFEHGPFNFEFENKTAKTGGQALWTHQFRATSNKIRSRG